MNNKTVFNDTDKVNRTLAIACLALAVASFLLIILNDEVTLGGLGYILIFVAGARGLKGDKRNLAIIGMALGAVSLVIFVIKLLIYIMK